MNRSTKNDLSAGVVTLDLDALRKTCAYAVENLKQECLDYIRELDRGCEKNDITLIYLSGERLSNVAKRLEIASDTYAAILGALDKEEIKIRRQ